MKNRIYCFLKKLKKEFGNKETIILFAIVVSVMYSPVWCGYFLYFLFRWRWCFLLATGYLLFWAGPFTPFFPLCIAITLFLKKFFNKDEE